MQTRTDERRFLAFNPIAVELTNGFQFALGIVFRSEKLCLVAFGKPLQIIEGSLFDFLCHQDRSRQSALAVLTGVFPLCPLPRFQPVPIKAKCQTTMTIYFH